MPYCHKCGAVVSEDANFCPKCGTPIEHPVNPGIVNTVKKTPDPSSYVKTTYDEVRNTFDWQIEYKSLWFRNSWVGINAKGIWLFTHQTGAYGFFHWDWIKRIYLINDSDALAIAFYDLQLVLDRVFIHKPLFLKTFIGNIEGDDVFFYDFLWTSNPQAVYDVAQVISNNDLCEIVVRESYK